MTVEQDNARSPDGSALSAELGPLPEPDGTAEANKERHPEGGYTYDEVPAWSEPLVRAYAAKEAARAVAAERDRLASGLMKAADKAHKEGLYTKRDQLSAAAFWVIRA